MEELKNKETSSNGHKINVPKRIVIRNSENKSLEKYLGIYYHDLSAIQIMDNIFERFHSITFIRGVGVM